MSNREPNEMDADEYGDMMDAEIHDERDPMDIRKDMLESEDVERARNAARGNLKLDCIAALKQSALKAHSDYCLAHGIKQDLGDGKRDDQAKAAQCNGHFERMGRGE